MQTVELDHVAFVVGDLVPASAELAALGLAPGEVQEFADEGTREQYMGQVLLMQPLGDDGPYASAFARRGPGLHHVALRVGDLDAFLEGVVTRSGWLLHPHSFRTRRES